MSNEYITYYSRVSDTVVKASQILSVVGLLFLFSRSNN